MNISSYTVNDKIKTILSLYMPERIAMPPLKPGRKIFNEGVSQGYQRHSAKGRYERRRIRTLTEGKFH